MFIYFMISHIHIKTLMVNGQRNESKRSIKKKQTNLYLNKVFCV